MDYERTYYKDINYHPYLFYVVFGVEQENLEISKEKHHVDEFPEGLEFVAVNRENDNEYMELLFGGTIGKVLERNNPGLYRKAKETKNWAIIRGKVQNDTDLRYMRNVIGFIQAMVEKNASGILDLLTMTLYEPSEWTDRFFSAKWNPYAHVVILSSKMENNSVWLHTRGMCKFGRPDVSMNHVPEDEIKTAAAIINQMIYYGVQGAFFSKTMKLHIDDEVSCVMNPEYMDDFNNPDFNNAYYQIDWNACTLEAK